MLFNDKTREACAQAAYEVCAAIATAKGLPQPAWAQASEETRSSVRAEVDAMLQFGPPLNAAKSQVVAGVVVGLVAGACEPDAFRRHAERLLANGEPS